MSDSYKVIQQVEIKDINNEPILTVLFTYGTTTFPFQIGGLVVVPKIGLREFEVVYDTRTDEVERIEIISVEYDLRTRPQGGTIILKPTTLIVGLHDVGQPT
ncbi:hypothetical protein [Paenibacillus tarimensis]|uniref:hypothetical protein n=1 Tax=Paenibacillus tarimensis TaxID=416012 RepID=UPI001F453BAB|nr:hypothetical protein [Paenibacillus tarimensis]MCF2944564.1 hypothetical protein [Paenibacillus tarimensis]